MLASGASTSTVSSVSTGLAVTEGKFGTLKESSILSKINVYFLSLFSLSLYSVGLIMHIWKFFSKIRFLILLVLFFKRFPAPANYCPKNSSKCQSSSVILK